MRKETKISKELENILRYYADEKKELEDKFQELVRAEQVILKQLLEASNLGDGEYGFEKRGEDLYLVCTPTLQEDAPNEKLPE